MTNHDPLLMSADITLLEAERPDLDVELIAAMYRHVLAVEGRQPTLAEFRAYVDHVSCLGEGVLRRHLGLEARGGRRPARMRLAERTGDGGAADEMPRADATNGHEPRADDRAGARSIGVHAPGRPGWTRALFATRYQAARDRATPPHTYRSIAAHFEMLDGSVGADPDHLRKLVKRYGPAPE